MSEQTPTSSETATDWSYTEQPDGTGIVRVGEKTWRTDYSRGIVELLVRRKGSVRMPRYLSYREARSPKLDPLFKKIEEEGRTVSILEPGCSAGHLSEAILHRKCVSRLVSFDPDEAMIEICREKKAHFGFDRWEAMCASDPDFTQEVFDVVLMSAMLEHVDPVLREKLVRACYASLAPGGLLVVLESQNRHWPFEYHVIRLPIPYLHYLPARWIYRVCRLFGRYGADWTYEEFANPNTGWWGAALADLKPGNVRVREVTEQYGYGAVRYLSEWRSQGLRGRFKTAVFRIAAAAASLFGISKSGLLPAIYAVFQKES